MTIFVKYLIIFLFFLYRSSNVDVMDSKKYPIQFLRDYEPLRFSKFKSEGNVKKAEQFVLMKHHRQLQMKTVKLEFSAFRRNFRIVAKSATVDTMDTVVQFHQANRSSVSKLHELGIDVYNGALVDAPGSFLTGYFNEGVFQSIIMTEEEIYNIEPASSYIAGQVDFDAIIFRERDLISSDNNCNNFDEETGPLTSETTLKDEILNSPFTKKVCTIEVIVDYTLYSYVRIKSYLLHEMVSYVQLADKIFRQTDFNRDSVPDNIGLQLKKITVYKDDESQRYPFKTVEEDSTVSISELLKMTDDYENNFCLVHFFVHRSFINERNGMARSGSFDESGICINSHKFGVSRNTGITTTKSDGKIRLPVNIALTFVHGIGHGFGAAHNSFINNFCGSSAIDTFLMHEFPNPNSLYKENFSNCSIDAISAVLHRRGPWCLIDVESPECGNGVTEVGEECDCGPKENCDKVDSNCIPVGNSDDMPCFIKRSQNKTCSDRESPCCTTDGQIVSVMENKLCNSKMFECQDITYCDGWTAECEQKHINSEGEFCADNSRVCISGICRGSVCLDHFYLNECECKEPNSCDICCIKGGLCQSVSSFYKQSFENIYFKKQIGEFCCNNSGFCNRDSECIKFKHFTVKKILKDNYIYSLIYISVLAFLIFLMPWISSCILFKKYSQYFLVKNFHKLVVLNKEKWKKELDSVNESIKNNVVRIATLFPTVSFENILQLLEKLDEEELVVVLLIMNGIKIRNDFFNAVKIPSRTNINLDMNMYKSDFREKNETSSIKDVSKLKQSSDRKSARKRSQVEPISFHNENK